MPRLQPQPLDQLRRGRARLRKRLVRSLAQHRRQRDQLPDGWPSLLRFPVLRRPLLALHAHTQPEHPQRVCNAFVPDVWRLLPSELDEAAERIREPHLRDRARVHLEEPRRADEVGEAARPRDRHVQAGCARGGTRARAARPRRSSSRASRGRRSPPGPGTCPPCRRAPPRGAPPSRRSPGRCRPRRP